MVSRGKSEKLRLYMNSDAFRIEEAFALIEVGAHPDTCDNRGDTLLHRMVQVYAILVQQFPDQPKEWHQNGFQNRITQLVKQLGANLSIRNKSGLTPAQCLGKAKQMKAMREFFRALRAEVKFVSKDSASFWQELSRKSKAKALKEKWTFHAEEPVSDKVALLVK